MILAYPARAVSVRDEAACLPVANSALHSLTYDPTPDLITGRPRSPMFFVLAVVLIITLVGSIPKWPHCKGVGLGLVLLVLLILAITHRLNPVCTVWRPDSFAIYLPL